MVITAVLCASEYLMVFDTDPEDDMMAPYQTLALELLAKPEQQVRWLLEDPYHHQLIPVPRAFIQALVDFKPDEATELLRQAVIAYQAS